MSAITYRPEVREQAGRILWADAELLDHTADVIDTCTSIEEAVDYLRDIARRYRQAASAATAGRNEL